MRKAGAQKGSSTPRRSRLATGMPDVLVVLWVCRSPHVWAILCGAPGEIERLHYFTAFACSARSVGTRQ